MHTARTTDGGSGALSPTASGAPSLTALLTGAMLLGAWLTLGAAAAPAAAAADHANGTDAAALYREALATTRSWRVHYVSSSRISELPVVESGDAGPVSGSQQVVVGEGSTADQASIVVIGGLTYLNGNASALVDLAGIEEPQAATAAGQWIVFPTGDAALAQIVVGVRSGDVAKELALHGPYSLGRARTLDGIGVDAIEGTQMLTGDRQKQTATRVVLYIRARGAHVPVEEDSLGARGQPTSTEHTVYSRWGEVVRPGAPQATITVGPLSTT